MTRTVIWPKHWSRRLERRGFWLAEGHTLKRDTPTSGSWMVRCPRQHGLVVGSGTVLDDAVEALDEHLLDCPAEDIERPDNGPDAEHDPAECAAAIRGGYAPICRRGTVGSHCNGCRYCPGHHADGCRDGRPLRIRRIAGRLRKRGTPPRRMVVVRLPEPVEVPA